MWFVFLLRVIVLVLVSAARSVQNVDCKRLENWLVLFDDFLICDTTQLVNLNCMTVNLPFSLFSSYIFPIHLFDFDYRQYSILIFPFCLQMAYLIVVYARSSSLDFDLVRLDFPPDFLKLFFLLQYLSIFLESTVAGVSIYNQASILDAQSKELE